MSKLLWHSNSPHTGTGYAVQTALFAPELCAEWDVGISAFYGVEGAPIKFDDIPVYPGIGQTWGNETIHDHARIHFDGDLRGGLVVGLQDVWPLNPNVWRELNHVAWTPIDHEPCPPPIAQFFKDSGSTAMAMSRFGERQMKDAGLEPLYCPHAVDTSIYKPHPKSKAREDVNMPADAFIVGMVAANKGNPSRKCFAEALQAFKVLRERHSDAILYLHTELTGRFDGVNIPHLAENVGLDLDSLLFTDQYRAVYYPFPAKTMAKVFSCLDVLLATSQGEGFGIPTLEAQSCGVPVIVSDFSAQPELCGAGELISGVRHYTPLKAWQFLPNVEQMVEALETAYGRSRAERKALSAKARRFAKGYDVHKVVEEHMIPELKSVGAVEEPELQVIAA